MDQVVTSAAVPESVHRRLLKRAAIPGLLALVITSTAVTLFPSAYPGSLAATLRLLSHHLDPDFSIVSMQQTDEMLDADILIKKLEHFTDINGQPGRSAILSFKFGYIIYNIYPILVLTILASIPMGWKPRLLLLGIGCLLVFVIGMIDMTTIYFWMGNKGMAELQAVTRFMIGSTPENRVLFDAFQADIKRLTLIKSFISTGGRQFMAVAAVGFSLLIFWPFRKVGTTPR